MFWQTCSVITWMECSEGEKMIAKRNLIITLMASMCLLIALIVSVCLSSNASAAKNNGNIQIPQLKVVIAHSNEGYASSIKQLLESKGIKVETTPIASISNSILEPYDLVIITGSERRLKQADYVREYNKPVLGYGVYGCAYFGKLKLKNGQPYT